MPIYNWAGYGVDIAAKLGVSGADEVAELFTGSFSTTIGSALEAYFGYHLEHSFGTHTELNVSGVLGGLGGFLTAYVMQPSVLSCFGVQGHAEWNLGSKTEVCYGGPKVDILRGPIISRVSYTPLTWKSAWEALHPSLQDAQPTDVAGNEVAVSDDTSVTAITALSQLLAISTAALELAIRFAYPDYNPSGSNSEDTDAFSAPKLLDDAVTLLSEMIMGIIYYLEVAGTYTDWTTLIKAGCTKIQEKAAALESYVESMPNLLVTIAGYYTSAVNKGLDISGIIAIALAILVVVAAIIAVVVSST